MLDETFDHAVVHHGYTSYMRDYELIIYATADPRTGVAPAYRRYLFRYCVEARCETSVPAETWRVSLPQAAHSCTQPRGSRPRPPPGQVGLGNHALNVLTAATDFGLDLRAPDLDVVADRGVRRAVEAVSGGQPLMEAPGGVPLARCGLVLPEGRVHPPFRGGQPRHPVLWHLRSAAPPTAEPVSPSVECRTSPPTRAGRTPAHTHQCGPQVQRAGRVVDPG